MKAYESLFVDVIKFEAQDVITTSVAGYPDCICYPTPDTWRPGDDGGVCAVHDQCPATKHDPNRCPGGH